MNRFAGDRRRVPAVLTSIVVCFAIGAGLAGCGRDRVPTHTMVWRTFVQTRYGQGGGPVPDDVISEIIADVNRSFGGSTTHKVTGYWLNPQTNRVEADDELEIEVACPRQRLRDAQCMALRIGRQLRQEAVYFEVRAAEVQLLTTSHAAKSDCPNRAPDADAPGARMTTNP